MLAWKTYIVCFENIIACCVSESKLEHVLQYLYFPEERQRFPELADIIESNTGPPGKISRFIEDGNPTKVSHANPSNLQHGGDLDDCQMFMKNISLVLEWGDVVEAVEEHVRRVARNGSFQASAFMKLYDNDDVRERIHDMLT